MHNPKNREWPYCDEFEFFKHKKVLHAKNTLSIRNISTDLSPYYENGQMMQLSYQPELRPDALKKFAACCYWDGEKINIALFIKRPKGQKEQVVLMKTHPQNTVFTVEQKHLLCCHPEITLGFWQKLKLLGPSMVHKTPATQPPSVHDF